ncbi:hypothetical protein [uncultured Parabacteroides sp.]|uniref:hypothetical protein n=1 Tax=uncultured Parabacteroides sp. TaxID=512312 RepID=UPI002605F6BA|nr:hypothetical protein [uncultured Parabacteroides sp.]
MRNLDSVKEANEVMTVEKANELLKEKRQFLLNNANAEDNIKKSAEVNVRKAERGYLEALKKVVLPTTQVIFWDLTNETEEQVTITKRQSEIIIATSDYSMSVAKTNIELGKGLITNDKFEKVPLYVTDANLFYDADITLKDLNGNIVEKGTPNVYVPVDSANGYWQWATYHEYNLNAIVKEEKQLVIENVQVKRFDSLQEFAQYRGVNNVLSRGFNGLEKAGNAALATQHEFYTKVFQKAVELKANISVVTKYYNFGKTIKPKVWNSAVLGIVEENFIEYDLEIGDEIIETLQNMDFTEKTIKNRYLIDAITRFANYKPQGKEKMIGIAETISTIKSLSSESVRIINMVTSDHINVIYTELFTQYLDGKGLLNKEQAA